MAHFAKLDENNIVIFVTVGAEHDDGKEQELFERTGDVYKQTSYNTRGGVYYLPNTNEPGPDQSKAFRKNYAGLGYTYDATRHNLIHPGYWMNLAAFGTPLFLIRLTATATRGTKIRNPGLRLLNDN